MSWQKVIETCRATLIRRGYWSNQWWYGASSWYRECGKQCENCKEPWKHVKTLGEYGLIEPSKSAQNIETTTSIDAVQPLWMVGTLLPIDFQEIVDQSLFVHEQSDTSDLSGSVHHLVRRSLSSLLYRFRAFANIVKQWFSEMNLLPPVLSACVVEYYAGPVDVLYRMWIDLGAEIVYTYQYGDNQLLNQAMDASSMASPFARQQTAETLEMYCRLMLSNVKFPVFDDTVREIKTMSFPEMTRCQQRKILASTLRLMFRDTDDSAKITSQSEDLALRVVNWSYPLVG